MAQYEYKVVPAPRRGLKGKGIKGAESRFAHAIQTLMNTQSDEGWEFLRAETLASEERHGLASAHTVYRDLLVFRRARAVAEDAVNPDPLKLSPPAAPDPEPAAPEIAAPKIAAPEIAAPEIAVTPETAPKAIEDWDEGEDAAPEAVIVTPFESVRRD